MLVWELRNAMLATLLLILSIMLPSASGRAPTYSVAGPNDSPSIVTLRHKLESGGAAAVKNFWDAVHKSGAPLIEAAPGATGFSLVTFLWHGDSQTRNVVIFDGVAGFDAKDQMLHLDGSDVWYKTYRVRNDARFARQPSAHTNRSRRTLSCPALCLWSGACRWRRTAEAESR
jgi:hypothetical protein